MTHRSCRTRFAPRRAHARTRMRTPTALHTHTLTRHCVTARSIAFCTTNTGRGASVLHPGTTLTAVMVEYLDSAERVVVPRRAFEADCTDLTASFPLPLGHLPQEVVQVFLRSCTAGTLLHLQATCHVFLLLVRIHAHPARWTHAPFASQLAGTVVGAASAGGLLACALQREDTGHLSVFAEGGRVVLDTPLSERVLGVAVSRGGVLMACMRRDNLDLYSLDRGVRLQTTQSSPGGSSFFAGVCFHANKIVVGSYVLLQYGYLYLTATLKGRVTALAEDGHRIVVAREDGRIDVCVDPFAWSDATDRHLQGSSTSVGLHVAIDGDVVAAAMADHSIEVWRGEKRTRIYTRIQHFPGVTALCLRDGTLLAATDGAELRVWDVGGDTVREAGTVLLKHKHPTRMILHGGVVTYGPSLTNTHLPFAL